MTLTKQPISVDPNNLTLMYLMQWFYSHHDQSLAVPASLIVPSIFPAAFSFYRQ